MAEGKTHAALRKAITRRHGLIARLVHQHTGVRITGTPGTYSGDSDHTQPVPRVSQSDGVAVFLDDHGKPATGVVIEIQRAENPMKAAVWAIYMAEAALDLDCEAWMLVIATSQSVGRWARQLGGGKYFKHWAPQVIVVDETNTEVPGLDGNVDDAILATWVREANTDEWENAAQVAIKLLRNEDDYHTLISGLENETQLEEIKNMVRTKEKPWIDVIIAEVRDEVRAEIRDEVRAEVRDEVRAEVRDKVRAEVRDEVRAEVRDKVRAEVRDEVRAEVRDKVRVDEQAKAARDKANLLKLLAQTHPDITPTALAAEKDALAAEAKLAELSRTDE